MIGNYLFARLSESAAVTALLGTGPVRVFPVVIPQRVPYPAVAYSCSLRPDDTSKQEVATRDTYLVRLRIWAPTEQAAEAYVKCEQIDAAIRSALDKITGTAGGVTIDGCEYDGGEDGVDEKLEFFFREARYVMRLVRPT